MADAEIVEALAECLEALRRGEADVEACLERHAAYRVELEALLAVARLIPRLAAEIAPAPAFRERTRRRLRRLLDGAPGSPTDWGWQHPSFH